MQKYAMVVLMKIIIIVTMKYFSNKQNKSAIF